MSIKQIVLQFFFLILSVSMVFGQGNYNALPWKQDVAFNSYLMRTVHQQYQERELELGKVIQSKDAMLKYRDELRQRYKTILGDLPEKHPLNAKVSKTSKQKGFRIETIIFESMPKRYVTANLYIPEGKGPFAASLELCGHGIRGKLGSSTAVLMALNGIAVLVVDPIGQGERVQLLNENGEPATRGATTEHTLLNVGCNLVGSSLAAYEWYDNHRAIDYLETRSDIDKNKLGAYGSSGGGTQVAYLIGLEDRLKVASIDSYFSQRERVLELNGPSDGCQHIPGEGSAHIEISDWATMFAPKPILVMAGLYDFVDYWGAVQGADELYKVYATLGEKDAVKFFTAQSGHGMPKVKREVLTTWFRTWLYNDPTPVIEKQVVRIPDDEMQCTSTGQVNTSFADAVSIPKYNEELAKKSIGSRKDFLKKEDAFIRDKIVALLGIDIPKEKIYSEQTGFIKGRTYDVYKYQILREGEMPIPCLVVIPETISSTGKVILQLNENGKDQIVRDEAGLLSIVNEGNVLVVADLRGYGETEDPAIFNDTKYWNKEYRNAMISLHTGKSIIGERVIDVFSLVDFIVADSRFSNLPIKLEANGTYGPVAVHSAFLDKRIGLTEISRSIKSYMEFIEHPMQRDAYTNVVPGVLKYYDLKDLVEKAGSGRIRFVD